MKNQILSKHVAVVQQIVDFIQSMGWDVDGLSVYRYDENNHSSIFGSDEDEKAWKTRPVKYKWGLELKVSPKDDDDEQRKARERQVQ